MERITSKLSFSSFRIQMFILLAPLGLKSYWGWVSSPPVYLQYLSLSEILKLCLWVWGSLQSSKWSLQWSSVQELSGNLNVDSCVLTKKKMPGFASRWCFCTKHSAVAAGLVFFHAVQAQCSLLPSYLSFPLPNLPTKKKCAETKWMENKCTAFEKL